MTLMSPTTPASAGLVLPVRYRAVQILKQAEGVETILAEDHQAAGAAVVVKRTPLTAVGSTTLARLQHEATVLSRLRGGPDPALLACGVEDGYFWLAQRFVPGETLQSRLSDGPLSIDDALRMAGDVLAQLSQAHEAGVVHRDVKPANVMLGPGPGVDSAVLIDYGLARSSLLDPEIRDQPVGTARYVSPEQAGLVDAPLDQRGDLYSFGVLLFESLAGHPPFDGTDVGAVLHQHLTTAAPDLRTIGVRVPRALAEVVERLLRKDPGERYQTAGAVLTDIESIASARRAGVADPAMVGRADRWTTLTEPAFVGRTGELHDLAALLEAADDGLGGLAVVAGESGSGKSRLLDELARLAGERGTWVLRGQGVDQGPLRPFQLLDGVAGGVLDALVTDAGLAPQLRARLGDFAEPAAAALPCLAPFLSAHPDAALPEEHGETRSVAALAAFLDALGTPERPALIILDDCQWAPAVTARILAQWRRHQPPSGRRAMVVVAFRSDEVVADSPLRSIRPDAMVTLGPLGPVEMTDLIGSMAGPLPSDAVATVQRLSEGSPFMAQAVLRGMVECGALVGTPTGWGLDPLSHGQVQASRRAALFLMRRLELLSPSALRLLEVGATLGKEFDLDLAVALTGLPAADAGRGLDDALRRRILWVDESGGRAQFLHDKLRQVVLDRLDTVERRALHLEAARAIEATAGSDLAAPAFDLAYHFDAAGHAGEALPYALAAAEQARSQHALDIAETNYLMAERGAGGAPSSTRARVAEGLGDVLALRGRYAEAETHLEQALELTVEPVRRAALEGKLGDVAFRRGNQGHACRLLEGALRRLGHRVPRSTLGLVPGVLWAIFVQAAHTLIPGMVGRSRRPATESEVLTMQLHSRLTYAYWFRSGMVACGWSHLRGLNLAERFPPSPELAQAYSEHAPVMTMIPWYSRGLTYARRSLAIRIELGDVWGQGQSLHFYGVVLYAASRYRESLTRCEEAVRLLSRTGDQWEMNTATWHTAFCHYRLGDLVQAATISAQLYADATEIGDQASTGIALSGWSRATNGRLPAAIVAAELARTNEDVHTATEVRLAEAIRLLDQGQPTEAVALLQLAHQEVRRAHLRQEYAAPVLPWLATALRRQMESLPSGSPSRPSLTRRRRTTRGACRQARRYRNNLPHALRERALADAATGRIGRARRLLDRSIAVATSQDAAYEAARSRVARGRLGLALGWPDALADQRAADDAMARMAPPDDSPPTADPAFSALIPGRARADGDAGLVATEQPALTGRFAALLSAGRTIAAATSEPAVHRAVRDAVASVLPAERAIIFELRGSEPVLAPTEAGGALDQLSRSLIGQAMATGEVATASSGAELQVDDSGDLTGVRSALCAPINRGGKVTGGFFVTHRQVAGVFGDEEQRLASFIAAVAGATLDHVAGSEAHFRALVRNSHDLTVVSDASGRALYVSPSITRILGYVPADFTTFDGGLIHADDRERVLNAFRLARFSPASHPTAELRAQHRDGSWRWLEMTISNLLADTSIRGLVFNIRDITDRKSAEVALGQATEQFRLSFENAPIGMALISIDLATQGWLLRVNDAMADMLGYTRAELEGRTIAQITHPDDRVADLAAMARFQTNHSLSFTTEKRYLHADGHDIWVQLQSSMVAADDGPRKYVISQMLDITERRAAEERLTFLALHDPLTGLANRRLLLDRLSLALARAPRSGRMVAVLYLDLDRFKTVNDSLGHELGDQLLLQASSRLSELVRDADTLCRLGGDEFVLVVDDLAGPEEALVIARRIQDSFCKPFDLPGGVQVSVTASVGVAVAAGSADPKTLLRHADEAMYQAKQEGRSCSQLYRRDVDGASV